MLAFIALLATQSVANAELTAWRTPDSKGAACASCHSPDGIELSAYGFGSTDIVRRASAHLNESNRALVLKQVLGGRKALPKQSVLTPEGRPMQPGGVVLPGNSPEERDVALLMELRDLVPALFNKPIQTASEAKVAASKILSLDLRSVRVGIIMNRLSEDGFHGPEHASLANWIPDVAIPISPVFIAAQEAYLDCPTPATLALLDEAARRAFTPKSPIESLSLAKYRCLLVMQHHLRQEAGLASPAQDPIFVPLENPFWQIGDMARMYANANPNQLGLPADMQAKKTAGPSIGRQLQALRLPWFWLGWLEDPSLTQSGPEVETRQADYFVETLLDDSHLPAHAAFMLARKLLEQTRQTKRPFEIQFSYLLLKDRIGDREPRSEEGRRLFRTFIGNVFRTIMYTAQSELARTGITINPESQSLQIKLMRDYLNEIGEPETALADHVMKSLSTAKVKGRRTQL